MPFSPAAKEPLAYRSCDQALDHFLNHLISLVSRWSIDMFSVDAMGSKRTFVPWRRTALSRSARDSFGL